MLRRQLTVSVGERDIFFFWFKSLFTINRERYRGYKVYYCINGTMSDELHCPYTFLRTKENAF